MDGNKDEAVRCIGIAEQAIASRNKEKALKFIKIAQRLNRDLSVDDLLTACENLGFSGSNSNQSFPEKCVVGGNADENKSSRGKIDGGMKGERNYTEEHVELIRRVNRNKDYYAVLGVEKSCSVEEIRKAYRKLSLKVHPDKNKAPGSEDAFKKVCKAFKCLSEDSSRREYDQSGLVDEFEYNQQHNVRRARRRRNVHDFYDDDFDPDVIFRSFFGQTEMFRAHHVYRTRATGERDHQREVFNGGGSNLLLLLQIVPFLLIFLLAYLPFSEPVYSLHKNYSHQIPQTTEKHGVEFFVKSSAFDENYPIGSTERANIEDTVIKDYRNVLWRHCQMEMQRRHWNKHMPTPHCDRLRDLGLA
ncbi:chaperone protein dnaJ 49 [Mercurialis annua]|uniref:chaperone protein dnaJ 49 n=1 Tax=Mercurialis annua TaxID=3986 RepID=UPI0021600F74|nr:chaperone protein dnaJ 49 [Mercurialis annua]XP_050219340.1 chaperone protein dnaJ 49 [Mercurialis annua]